MIEGIILKSEFIIYDKINGTGVVIIIGVVGT